MNQNLPDDLQYRILALLDGTLDEEEAAHLDEELRGSEEARALFLQLATLHSALEDEGASKSGMQNVPVVPVELFLARERRRLIRNSLMAAAAVLLISGLVLWMQMVSDTTPPLADLRAAPNSIFRLSHTGNVDKPVGNALTTGSRVVLEHGVVELELPHNVSAIIEAPADITLVDERTLQLDHGRGFFRVPTEQGRGFTVVTQHQRIVDLGTAFGVDTLSHHDKVELHVFEGRVRVDGLDEAEGHTINEKRSVLLAGTRVERDITEQAVAFRKKLPAKVETILLEDFESGLVGGREYSVQIDPAVIRGFSRNRFPGIADNETWSFTTPSRGPAGLVLASFNLGNQTRLVSGDVPTEFNQDGLQFTGTGGTWANITSDTPSATSNGITLTFDPANGWQKTHGTRGSMGSGALRIYPDITSGDIPWTLTGLTPHAFYDMIWYSKNLNEKRTPHTGIDGFDAGNGIGASAPLDADRDQNFIGLQADATGSISGTWFRDGGQDIITAVAGVQIGISGVPDTTPPAVTRLHPPHNALGTAPLGRLTVQFNEPVQRGTGNIVIRELAGGGILETISMNSDKVSVRSSVLTIRPDKQPSTACFVEITAGSLIDLANNPFPGINGPGTWTLSPDPDADYEPAPTTQNDSPLMALSLHPSRDFHQVSPGQMLEITFGEPIKLGTGRVFIRNTTDWIESKLVVGDPRLSIDGNTLTINPPAGIEEGTMPMGWVGNWGSDAAVGLFNPKGDGSYYADDNLRDQGRGMIGAMRGPTMATFRQPKSYSKLRHELGPIAPDSSYTVSAAIGVRDDEVKDPTTFLGYTIRLVSGDTILAELSDDTPPGPPNSVTTIGFSWHSATLPAGVSPGAPLAIEIAPKQVSGKDSGYLDLDNVRVTVIAE
jgi:hypothetical protein